MPMKDLIIVRPERCIGCGVCIRTCPAPEANITKKLEDGKLITTVDPAKCIGCGECITHCRRGARDYVDDTEKFMSKVGKDEMIIIVDPTIKTAFPLQWVGILDWFKKNNCYVFDGAFGADIYVWAFLSLLDSGKVSNMISESCTAVMNYIRIYRPSLMKKLAPIYPPAVCAAIYIKNFLKKENKIAVLSPCTARKIECVETGLIDYSVTFRKLMDHFKRNGISIPNEKPESYEYPYADMQGQMGVLLSRPDGLKDNILQRRPGAFIESAQGVNRVYGDLLEYEKQPENKLPDAFDVLSCRHGCTHGHGCGTNQSVFEIMTNMRDIEAEARERMKSKGRFRNTDDRLFKRFDEELELDNFLRVFRPLKAPPAPSDVDIVNTFNLMEKKTSVEKIYNCGACGYSTCREMAIAIFKGLSCPEACAEYRKKHSKPLTEDEKNYEDILAQCRETANKLGNSILSMTGDMEDIAGASEKAAEKANKVNELMNNIVAFCNKNPTMDEASLKQLVKIIQTAIKSLTMVEDNISKAGHDSKYVGNSVGELDRLITELKDVLNKNGAEASAEI